MGKQETLKGTIALITGGGSGIGKAIASELAKSKCRVLITGRNEEKLTQTARSIESEFPVQIFPADVSCEEDVVALIDFMTSQMGEPSILVNNAGINHPHRTINEVTTQEWEQIIAINLSGAYFCTRECLPFMRKVKEGLIINISSVAGKRAGLLGGFAYNSSKFGMAALGLSVGLSEKDSGIRVTNIYPGEVETPILEHRPHPLSKEHLNSILQPEDVAEAVLMIANLNKRARIPELVIVPTIQSYS